MAPDTQITGEDNPLSGVVRAPLWLVLLLAGSGFGWYARPAADPEYVSKAQLLEEMQRSLAPVIELAQRNNQRSYQNSYRLEVLERRLESLEKNRH